MGKDKTNFPGDASMARLLLQVSMKMAEASDVDALMSKMDRLQTELDTVDGWEIDRQLDRALDALRCPPSDQLAKTLSGGERRRVAIARLVLERPQAHPL